MTFQQILSSLKRKEYQPVYFFEGSEPYFIDALSDYISQHVLSNDEKEFNQSILYGQDISPAELLPVVKRFPMMAEYQVVMVREAQNWRNLDALENILVNPVPSTILVINYKGKKLDGRLKISKLIKSKTVFFSSTKLRDNEVMPWISNHCKLHGREIHPKAAAMLADHIGNDIGKVVDALEKLEILTPKGETIDPDTVFKNIGISKDFNVFELQEAIGQRDDRKALFIATYFANNQKEHNLIPVASTLYRFFTKLIIYHSLVKTTDGQTLKKAMGVVPYFFPQYQAAAKNYGQQSLLQAIDVFHDIDLKAKGVNSSNASSGDLMKEMVARLLRA